MSFPVSSITKTSGAFSADALSPVSGTKSSSGVEFGSLLKSAVQQVDGYQQNANQAIQQFLQGNGELHNVALSTQRAEMAFDLGMQVRNKILSAYQEIMKMQL